MENKKCPCCGGEIEKIIEPAGLVLDPFMGAGTTAIVCKKLKRNFIGIEINEKYCELAGKRLNAAPTPLF